MINVFMVDHSESTIREVKKYFSSLSSVCIKKSFMNGKEAMADLLENSNNYDVVLMNPILPSLDGIGILKEMRDNNLKQKVIIYADYFNKDMIRMLADYNVSFYLLNSISMDVLAERIVDASKLNYQEYEFIDDNKLEKVSKLLHDLGMPSHIKGYQYIRDAIIMMQEDASYLGGITKNLYPEIAKKYGTTPSRVERAIRHAIEVSWTRGDYDLMDEIFGHSVDFDRAKPTNSEFLATISDRVHLDRNKVKIGNYNW